ncbi:MAG TPA: glycosyltransferase [bacterium]|nr:glycosyltransferase [bacterium]
MTAPETPSPIYVDATHALLNFMDPPSGIPRVERFIFLAALADPDPRVKIVRFRMESGTYREMEPWEKEPLLFKDEDLSPSLRGHSWGEGLKSILRRIRSNPTLGRSSDRFYARWLCQRHSIPWAFNLFKLFFRAYRLAQAFRQGRRGSTRPDLDLRGGILLLSDGVLSGPRLCDVIGQTSRRAFLCHDLIPILKPDFLDRPEHSGQFASNLNHLLRAPGTRVVCTSETSRRMMEAYQARSGLTGARLVRFPMPSMLYEKARRQGPVEPYVAEEPYVFFCSTVETRKNHLLLARVWQRALDEGVLLPKLVCAGRWGWGNEALADYLKAHPALGGRLVFTGQLGDSDLIEYYRGALFGVLPSFLEGWGLGASECLDFGLPVIVSTTPALKEATGGLMPALDPEDFDGWFAEIVKMAGDGDYRRSLREAIARSYRPVSTRESWESIKNSLWEA